STVYEHHFRGHSRVFGSGGGSMPLSRAVRGIIVGFSLVVLALSSALPASADGAASKWKVGYYTPSTPGTLSMSSAIQGGGIASFGFTDQNNTALLATTNGSFRGRLLGDLTGKTLTATFEISGATGAFTYFGEGTPENPCGTPANVRLFFTPDNSGGFRFTHTWWSNPGSEVL